MTVLLQILAPLVLNLPFTLTDAWEAVTSARLAARLNAMRAAGEPVTLADMAKMYPDPPAGRNAADLYDAAFKLADAAKLQEGVEDLPLVGTEKLPEVDKDFPADLLADVGAYVKASGQVLRLLHDAAALDECKFQIDMTKGMGMLLPHLSKMRGGARLLALEAAWLTESGKPDQAAESLWAGLRLGHALCREPVLVSGLVRIACDGIAVGQIERLVSRGSPSAAQLEKLESALRAEADPKRMERLFLAERCFGMSIYQDQILKPGGRGLAELGIMEPLAFRFIPRTYFKADMIEYVALMNQYVAAAKKPYPQSFIEGARIGAKIDEQIPKYYIICRMVLPALGRIFTTGQRHMAKLDSARVALAALRYKARNQRLPDKLGDLVPGFIEAVPLDPFVGKPLRYRRDADGFVIYGVGENGKDDGGAAQEIEGKPLDVGFRVRWPKGHF